MNLPVLNAVMVSITSVTMVWLFVQSFLVFTHRKKKWLGQSLGAYSFKREHLAIYLGLLGIMTLVESVSLGFIMPISDILAGVAKFGAAAVLIMAVTGLHAKPDPVGLTTRNLHRESSWLRWAVLVLVVWGILNIFLEIRL